jgi:anti-sigma-K factor RskA
MVESLPALMAGELSRAETEAAVHHLRACEECRRRLVGQVSASAALQSAARHAPDIFTDRADAPAAPAAGAEVPRSPTRRPRLWLGAAGAVAAAVVIALSVFAGSRLGNTPAHQAAVTLHLVGGRSGSGRVVMQSRGRTTDMVVATSNLPAPRRNHFYEVWLFDPATGKMLAVGVLAPNGHGAYALSSSLLGQYQAVDISVQANNGNPAHSRESVLRARYA